MNGTVGGEMLFILGIAVMAVAAVFGIAAVGILCLSGKKLNQELEEEYGPKRS